MANCATLTGYTYDACESNLGGIKRVWLAQYKEDAVSATSANVITGIELPSGATWIEFPMRKNTASMTSNLQVGEEGGNFVQTELSMVFSKMNTNKRMAMVALAQAEAMAIVEDANGIRWFLGKDNPITVSAGAGETGTQKTDPNHYTVTLLDDSLEYPMEVSKDYSIEA